MPHAVRPGLSCALSSTVSTLGYLKLVPLTPRHVLPCLYDWIFSTMRYDILRDAESKIDGWALQENSGYSIKTLTGPLESFEKEYYDLIRCASLEYR